MLVVLPNTVGPSRRLVDVLRARHLDAKERYDSERKFREANGIASTPDIDWEEERKRLKAMLDVVDGHDADVFRIGHMAGLSAMSPAPTDPGEFVEPTDLVDVTVRPRYTTARRFKTLRDEWARATRGTDEGNAAEDCLIAECFSEVAGLRTLRSDGTEERSKMGPIDADDLEILRGAGLTPTLLIAALYLTGLPSGKAMRSGVLPPQT
jgi:hypothetical protein